MLQSSVKVLKRTHVFNPVTKVVRFLALRLELCRQLRLLCHMLTGPGAVEAGVCVCVCVCVYYCRTYYKAVCGGAVKDTCYKVRRADACVDWFAHHVLENARERDIV
jgi:hypothetical protein